MSLSVIVGIACIAAVLVPVFGMAAYLAMREVYETSGLKVLVFNVAIVILALILLTVGTALVSNPGLF